MEIVVSPDEKRFVLFIYSGQSSQGFEVFTLTPVLKRSCGLAESYGHGSPPMFSSDSEWIAMVMDGTLRVRDTGANLEEILDECSEEVVIVDWAQLHIQHLSGPVKTLGLGVEVPLSSDLDEIYEWEPYELILSFHQRNLKLRMPWGEVLDVFLPADKALTCSGFCPD